MTNYYRPLYSRLHTDEKTERLSKWGGLVRLLLMLGVLVLYASAL